MRETKIDAVAFASAGAIVVISLTAAALTSVNALLVSGSIVVTSVLTAAAVCLWVRRQRTQRTRGVDNALVHPEVREFMLEGERFRARMHELAKRATSRVSFADRRPDMAETFDTLQATRELEAAGIEREQAEAIASTMRRAAAADHERLATKADLYQVALAIVVANAAITFGLLKLIP